MKKRYLLHPMINFTPRLYQETIFSTCALKNTLVVLPTGLGKTNVFLMVAAQRLKQYPGSKILFIGPTRPLIHQYYDVFKENFDMPEENMAIFTGNISPKKRSELWQEANIIFSTPQGLENDIISSRIDLKDVSLLGVDEAHRAVGDYAYVWIAKMYTRTARYPRILALTASPGGDQEKIKEVCENLHIEDIEIRTYDDEDVKPYVQEIDISYREVDLPKRFLDCKLYLETALKDKLSLIKENGFINSVQNISKRELLGVQGHLVGEMNQGNKDFPILRSLSLVAEAMKIYHAVELLESQGVKSLYSYMDRLMKEARSTKVKAVQNLARDGNWKSAYILVESLIEDGIEHPKFAELKNLTISLLRQNPKAKLIVFTQYRDTAKQVSEALSEVEGIIPQVFVGQQKKAGTGLSQKKQIEMLDEFREGKFNTIVMTSVGEEGLDIPKVDQVIFFEPVPSVIRHVQRRGRTGRQEKGSVYVLIAKNTRDVTYRWSTKHKEKRMYSALKDLKKNMNFKPQESLAEYVKDNVKIVADYREKGSPVIKNLIDSGTKMQLEKLEIADYVLSQRVGIEYKTAPDFVDSIVDGRLLSQVKDLRNSFSRPLIIVEGNQDIYSLRNVHPNAIKGMLATITVSFGIPVLYTRTSQETADLLFIVAKREQAESSDFTPSADRKPLTPKEQQEHLVSSLPGVGGLLAKDLLTHFSTIRNIANASEDELKKVNKVGPVIAKKISDLFNEPYEDA
ncbi:MAG: DEAD/DEAH box helicase [Candidatus Woesearchaeota archaeon]